MPHPGTLYGSSDKHRRFHLHLYGSSDKHRRCHLHLFGLSWSETEDDYDFFIRILKDAMGYTDESSSKMYIMMDDALMCLKHSGKYFMLYSL
jgi:hypothetical protein